MRGTAFLCALIVALGCGRYGPPQRSTRPPPVSAAPPAPAAAEAQECDEPENESSQAEGAPHEL